MPVSPLTTFYLASFSIPGSPEQRETTLKHLPLSRSTLPTTTPSSSGFIFPKDHSQHLQRLRQQQQSRFLHTVESQSLFCVIRIWKQKYGKLCWIPRPPRVFKFSYGFFIHIAYDSSNSDHQYQNALTSALEARRLHGSFRIILPKVSSLFPFFKNLSTLFKKLLLLEYPSFGDEKILLTALQILQLVFEKFRQTLMPVSPLTIVYFAFFSIRYRKTMS